MPTQNSMWESEVDEAVFGNLMPDEEIEQPSEEEDESMDEEEEPC